MNADHELLIGPEEVAALLGLVDKTGKPRVAAIYELTRSRSRDLYGPSRGLASDAAKGERGLTPVPQSIVNTLIECSADFRNALSDGSVSILGDESEALK
jgi:hypothetical protein